MKSLRLSWTENNRPRSRLFKTKRELRKTCDDFSNKTIAFVTEEYHKSDHSWHQFVWTTICRVCGRQLTDPESVKLGIGPDCRKK